MTDYGFSDPTTDWFNAVFDAPTPAQSDGWNAITSGTHTLIHAPTGSGKTLAAFLSAIDKLYASPTPKSADRCRVLYISPLKALAYDIDRNLRAPLTGIAAQARRDGTDPPEISVAMRTGDTPQSERQAMVRNPPDILITTPESLFLMLTSRAAAMLASVETVIIDEVHAIAGTKRGTHLALSLERLASIARHEPQRIGLSATQRPLETIAAFMAGGGRTGDEWTARDVRIVDAPADKELDIEIVVPVSDMTRPDIDAPDQDERPTRSIWPAMYPKLVELLETHRSTIFFVNSRSLAERTAAEINRLAGEEVVQAHHGSVSRDKRVEIEDRLKSGSLKGVVATSTLELGIDMAAVDLVVLVESPGSIASGLQRVGRAGHQVGAPSVARVFPKHRGDLLEAAVVVERMYAGDIEPTSVPQNPLDVLAQQLVSIAAVADFDVDDTYELVTRAMPYQALTKTAFDSVLDMLSGRFPSDEFAELRPRVVWDRTHGIVSARPNAKLLATINAGTIPDRGLYTVHLPDGGRVGELDEEMVYESRPGDTFVLGSTTWRMDEITHDRVIVSPAPGSGAATMPFWHGDGPGRPLALGRAVGAFSRRLSGLDYDDATAVLAQEYRLDPWAADNLARFVHDELDATGAVPSDRTIVVERFRDEIGDWRLVVLSPFGSRVHAPWALAARASLRASVGGRVDTIWSDDGIMFRFPDMDEPPEFAGVLVDAADIERIVIDEAADSALFASRFRESAARALLLPRRRPGQRTPLWLQRRKAADLLEVTRRYGSFPIVLETYREVLQDHFDLPALMEVLSDIDKRRTRVREVDVESPSPFATSLMFDFVASFMYDYDAPLAERKAAALTLDRSLLAEILGEPEFRELLDPDVIEAVESELQHLAEGRKVRSIDSFHDLLRTLGPLSVDEAEKRVEDPSALTSWVTELSASRRVYLLGFPSEEKLVAVEDMARLRDTVGVQPPTDVPTAFIEPVADPLGDVVSRYARTHGPFTVDEASEKLGLPEATVREVLVRLGRENRILAGAFRPGGADREWVSADVLRRLRRRSLAVLRDQVEAVDGSMFARFLPGWQGVGARRGASFDTIVGQLAGASIPISELESDVLARRVHDPSRRLDEALSEGSVVWVGREAIGTRDGRVALFPRSSAALLLAPPEIPDDLEPLQRGIVDHLTSHGASFFPDMYRSGGGGDIGTHVDALWDLVWAGLVTNDSFAPVRAYGKRRARTPKRPTVSLATPPTATGRWYLTSDLLADETPETAEERALALAHVLLDRYGVVMRSAVRHEGIPGGFSGLYPVLASLEDVGASRRGYFVEGMGGAQFGTPGAVDRLRHDTSSGLLVLSASDPANAYGSVLPWPDAPATVNRRGGARVVLSDGRLVAWMDPAGKRTAIFGDDLDLAAEALRLLADEHPKASIAEINGEPAHDHRIAASLRESGFTPGYKGFTVISNQGQGQQRERTHRRTPR